MAMLSTVSAEDLIGADHPIRRIKAVVDAVLGGLDAELAAMYPPRGRPSVPPEMLLKASVLMALYSVRSERAFCERLNYDIAIDERTTRHAGYAVSQQARKRVEEPFGWIKTIAGGRKLRHKGRQRNRAWFLITAASYNLVRIARLDTPTH